MKTILIFALALVANIDFAMACGGSDDFTGVAAAQAALDGKLSCTLKGKSGPAVIGIFAKFKCLFSPVYGRLEIFDQKQTLASVNQLSETAFEIRTVEEAATYLCQLEKPNISKKSKDKALKIVEDVYESIVGQSYARGYEITSSETVISENEGIIETLVVRATLDVDHVKTRAFDFSMKIINGEVDSLSVNAIKSK